MSFEVFSGKGVGSFLLKWVKNICRRNLSQLFAVGICHSYLPWEFAAAIYRGFLPWKFAVAICLENLLWLCAVGLFCVYRQTSFLCEQIPFFCKQSFFNCKQTFFICEQNLFIYENFFINSVSFCYCRGSYGPPYFWPTTTETITALHALVLKLTLLVLLCIYL